MSEKHIPHRDWPYPEKESTQKRPFGQYKAPKGHKYEKKKEERYSFSVAHAASQVVHMLLLEQQSLCAAMDKMVMHPSVHAQARADCQEHGRHAKEDSSIPGETSLSQPSSPWHCRASKRWGLQLSKSSTAAFMFQAMRADGMSHICWNAGVETAKAVIITA